MKIQKLFGNEGARKAEGFVIVIDIVRAATVQTIALFKGVKYIISVATKEEAFLLKEKNPKFLLIGEEDGYKIPGFDFGNSPTELLSANILGKVLIHRSSAGTQGLVNATKADDLIFGSFLSANAIINKIREVHPDTVSLVSTAGEDGIFADYIISILSGKVPKKSEVEKQLFSHPRMDWFLDPEKKEFPMEDISVVLEIDKVDFYCKVLVENGLLKTLKSK